MREHLEDNTPISKLNLHVIAKLGFPDERDIRRGGQRSNLPGNSWGLPQASAAADAMTKY